MPVVFIPSLMRDLTGGQERVRVKGATVRQVINSLEEAYPGIRGRVMEDDRIHPSIAVFIDGEPALLELLEPVGEESEVHLLPALGGGAGGHAAPRVLTGGPSRHTVLPVPAPRHVSQCACWCDPQGKE